MTESYPGDDVSVAAPSARLTRELIARLVPGADSALLVAALLAERDAPPISGLATVGESEPAESSAAARELRRVRGQYALGASARESQHDINNPLTALLAEAQLLELEPLADEHRAAAARIVGLARRIVTVMHRTNAHATTSSG